MNIVFFGTPDFVVPIAQSLLHIPGCQLRNAVTSPDRPAGRSQILTSSPIKKWALGRKIKVIDFDTMVHTTVSIKTLFSLGVLAAYGKIIPQSVINLFPKGILVIHPSLLPKYRGASPIPAAIAAGEQVTGVSIIRMDEKFDHGPIVYQFKEKILESDTNETLRERLFKKTAELLPKIITEYLSGTLILKPQDHKAATYTKLISKDDGKIDWKKSPEQIERFIRAMSPWPTAWTPLRLDSSGQTKRLKILKAHLNPKPYTLIPDLVQLEGKKPVSFEEFKRGYPKTEFL